MIMEVSTDRELSPGQSVRLQIEGRSILLASFILFIVPLIDFIIGVIAGMFLARLLSYEQFEQEFEIVMGILFFSSSFYTARWLDKRFKKDGIVKVDILD